MSEVERRMNLPAGGDIRRFAAEDGTSLRYGLWPARPEEGADSADGTGTVILLPGRTEFIEKYAEVIADLLDRGLAVVCMDWRGQGLSDRPLANRSKHYYTDFAPVADDLAQLMADIEKDRLPRPMILLAHSMGGHLALRFLHDHPGVIDRAVFSAPMIDIRTAPTPKWLARALARISTLTGRGKSYAPRQGDYGDFYRSPANMNLLTSDPDRFMDEHNWIDHNPDLALGGITYGWLDAAFRSIDILNAPGYPEAITTPTLVIQAGADALINNDRQSAFVARLGNGRLERIEGARHEMLKERDDMRDQFWGYFDDFV